MVVGGTRIAPRLVRELQFNVLMRPALLVQHGRRPIDVADEVAEHAHVASAIDVGAKGVRILAGYCLLHYRWDLPGAD